MRRPSPGCALVCHTAVRRKVCIFCHNTRSAALILHQCAGGVDFYEEYGCDYPGSSHFAKDGLPGASGREHDISRFRR